MNKNHPFFHVAIIFYYCFGDDDDVAVLIAVPNVGPVVEVNGKAGRNHVELIWNEIAPSDRRGFITNYTIYYRHGDDVYSKSPPEVLTAYLTVCFSALVEH